MALKPQFEALRRRQAHPLKRMALVALVWALLPRPARAQETPPPAAPPPAAAPLASDREGGDALLRDLLARQRLLEEQVRAQQRLLDKLQPTAELPVAPPRPVAHLAVPWRTISESDPELRAPLAGYADKSFFLRDRHSWFVIVPKGRVHVDYYNFLNRGDLPAGAVPNGAADPRTSLRDTLFIKRARLGLAGTIAHGIDFRLENDFASQAGPGQYGTLADASVVINYTRYLRLEAGQFYVPFTLENVTSENYTDFMEKAAAVRYVAPSARDLGAMLFGDLPRAAGRWYLGVFNGDGQNSKNLDNSPALISRVFVAPLSLLPRHAAWLELVWLGASIWWQPTENQGGSVAPSTSGATAGDLAPFATQGGLVLFNPVYSDGANAMKNAIKAHLAPDGTTLKYALELNVPIGSRFGVRAELMHQSIDFRQYQDVNPGNGNLTRTAGARGNLAGLGTYVEAYAWIGGPINSDKPGLYQVPHWAGYVPPPPPRWALQLAVKYEHVEQEVTGLPAKDPALGKTALDVFSAGANFWVTRHARVMADYVMNYVGNVDIPLAAPQLQKNLFFKRAEHELLFRLDVHL